MATKPSTQSAYSFITVTLAPMANEKIALARQYRRKWANQQGWILTFDSHWRESTLLIYTIGGSMAFIGSWICGYDIFQSLMNDIFFKGQSAAPWYAAFGLSGIFSAASLYCSHLAAHAYWGKYQEWLVVSKVPAGTGQEIIRYNQQLERRKSVHHFWLVTSILALAIAVVSYQRYLWLSQGNENTGSNFPLILVAFCIVFEILLGEGAVLWARRQWIENDMKKTGRQYREYQADAADLDKKVALLWHTQKLRDGNIAMLGDVKECIRRAAHRNTGDDHYTDTFDDTFEVENPEMLSIG